MYYIIEHPTKGVFKELDPDTYARARFGWSLKRSEGFRFTTIDQVKNTISKMNPKVAEECGIRRSPRYSGNEWYLVRFED